MENIKKTKSKSPINLATFGVIFSFLVLSIILKLPLIASTPGRTLVFHNNTGATLYLLNWSRWISTGNQENVSQQDLYNAANIAIPPNSKRSLFNFLDPGHNNIFIYAKHVRPVLRHRVRSVQVTGYETRAKELFVFPRDFGKTAMFDAGGHTNTNEIFRPGYYQNTNGDSGYFKSLGGGKYQIELWQGKERIPDKTSWYCKGEGTMQRDGRIHSTQPGVQDYASSDYTFQGIWKLTGSGTIQLEKYRNYLTAHPPNSATWGWKSGPVYTYVSE